MLGGEIWDKRAPIFTYLLSFWSRFLIPCTHVAAALESSRTRRIYSPTASQIIEVGLVLKEKNCLFPWGRLSCVKMTAQKIPSLVLTASYLRLLKPLCVPGPPWPSLLLSLSLMPAVNSLTPPGQPSPLCLSPPSWSHWQSHRRQQSAGCMELEESRCCERTILLSMCWDAPHRHGMKQITEKQHLLEFMRQLFNSCNFKNRLWSCLFAALWLLSPCDPTTMVNTSFS